LRTIIVETVVILLLTINIRIVLNCIEFKNNMIKKSTWYFLPRIQEEQAPAKLFFFGFWNQSQWLLNVIIDSIDVTLVWVLQSKKSFHWWIIVK